MEIDFEALSSVEKIYKVAWKPQRSHLHVVFSFVRMLLNFYRLFDDALSDWILGWKFWAVVLFSFRFFWIFLFGLI